MPSPWGEPTGSRPGRAIDWLQRRIVVPSGRNAGERLVLAAFQADLIEIVLDPGAQAGAVSIPSGNAKSTLFAALGLWAVATEPDSPQVPLVASNGLQARRTLLAPMQRMIELDPELTAHLKVRLSNTDPGVLSKWNGGKLQTLPADAAKLQGLNPTLALVDEAEEVPLDALAALEDRLGKRPEALVAAIGTPGTDPDSALATIRDLHAAGADYRVVEYGAPIDADITDRRVWEASNPALEAGILGYEAFERDVGKIVAARAAGRAGVEAKLTQRFRLYRLGTWMRITDGEATWLPVGAWEACPVVPPPADGEGIVVAVDGTYRRSTAVVGASIESGAVFLLWAGELADDDEVAAVIDEAARRFNVTEIVHYPTIRPDLIDVLDRRGHPLREWDLSRKDEAKATNALYQSITEGRFRHDGSELLATHFANVGHRESPHGTVLRRVHREGFWIDAAMAARMAWTRVQAWQRSVPVVF